MKRTIVHMMICGVLAALLAMSCGKDSAVSPGPAPQPEPQYLPEIPVPRSVNDPLPAASEFVDVGISNPLHSFVPVVSEIEQMKDDGSLAWITENRRLKLVCGDGVLAHAMCDVTRMDNCYVSESPRLLHKRYWKRLKHVVLDPGTSYSRQETVTYGSSTTNTVSQSFSQTIGIEVTAGGSWGAFSAEVKTSYSQTTTREEINSVTFSEESSFTDTYAVDPDQSHVIVYGLWQLVDVFVLTDSNKVPIHASDTLTHARIPEIAVIEFLNKDVIYQKVTKFDPVQ